MQNKVKEIGVQQFAELDAKVLKAQKTLGNNVVAFLWTDTVVYKRAADEIEAKTVVPVGDLSKCLTTALVMQFVDEGKISLDDKVAKYIPEFDKYGKNYITTRHCLSGYDGIDAEPVSLKSITGRKHYQSLEEAVNDWPKKEIKSNPGTEFRYSNAGFDIAARIIEIVCKKKFETIIKQKLFNP